MIRWIVRNLFSFSHSLSLPRSLIHVVDVNLAEVGFSSPTPVQMFTIPMVLMRRDVLVCAPTGSGKSELQLSEMHNTEEM